VYPLRVAREIRILRGNGRSSSLDSSGFVRWCWT
jgi:hypothetical protein